MPSESDITELRERMWRVEAGLAHLFKHLNIDWDPDSQPTDRIVELLRSGAVLEAVKEYHETHGVGLAEAKKAVEAIKATYRL